MRCLDGGNDTRVAGYADLLRLHTVRHIFYPQNAESISAVSPAETPGCTTRRTVRIYRRLNPRFGE